MGKKRPISESESESDDSDVIDSDTELQEAFARGELQPGLVVMKKSKVEDKKMPAINNTARLEARLNEIKLPADFHWVERLDIVNDLAPLAPEIAFQLDDHKEKREKVITMANIRKSSKKTTPGPPPLKSIEEDPIHNDFKREMTFYRQAQQAILTCLPRLKALDVPTKRPNDYFAEMAKSDEHMKKVTQILLKKQTAKEKADKVRKIRDQKKFAKQTQVHAVQERQKAKREMIEDVKKYRKGQKNSLDFLDDKRAPKKSTSGRENGRTTNKKRESKNEKYGYGGQKKGTKWNTRESLDNFGGGDASSGGRGGRISGGGRGGSRGGSRGSFGGGRGRGGSRGGGGGRPDRNGTSGRGGFGGSGGGGFGRGRGGGGRGRGGGGRGRGSDGGGRGRGGPTRGKPNRPGKESRKQARVAR